jgi:hypothetical protein
MRVRNSVLVFALALGATGLPACSVVGDAGVKVETGNQPVGYLSRPMTITLSSDEAVQRVAQRICDNVRPGSYASVTFVGKEPSSGMLDLSDTGRYRYECQTDFKAAAAAGSGSTAAAAAPAPAAPAAAPPAMAPVAAPAAPPSPVAPEAAAPVADEAHRRDCQRRQGAYQVCVGSCLLNSTSPAALVAAECQKSCAPSLPVACN